MMKKQNNIFKVTIARPPHLIGTCHVIEQSDNKSWKNWLWAMKDQAIFHELISISVAPYSHGNLHLSVSLSLINGHHGEKLKNHFTPFNQFENWLSTLFQLVDQPQNTFQSFQVWPLIWWELRNSWIPKWQSKNLLLSLKNGDNSSSKK